MGKLRAPGVETSVDYIELGPHYRREGHTLTVQQLAQEMEDVRLAKFGTAIAAAEKARRYVLGRMADVLDEGDNLLGDLLFTDSSIYRRNHLLNLWLTWTARFVQDQLIPMPYPRHFGADSSKAAVARAIAAYLWDKHDMHELIARFIGLVQTDSTAYLFTTWNPADGPESAGFHALGDDGQPLYEFDPDTPGFQKPVIEGAGEPIGDVSIEVVTILEGWHDGSDTVEQSQWFTRHKYIDQHVALAMIRAAGVDTRGWDPPTTERTTLWGGSEENKVRIQEIWHKPNPRIPKGLYALLAADQVVMTRRPFPYRHRELPASQLKLIPREDSPVGATHVHEALGIQREHNEVVANKAQRVRDMGNTKLILHPQLEEQWDAADDLVVWSGRKDDFMADYFAPPPPDEAMVLEVQNTRNDLNEVFGTSDLVVGTANASDDTSGTAISYQNQIEQQKKAIPQLGYKSCIKRVLVQSFKLYQQYSPGQRLVHIAGGPHMEPMIHAFKGADLAGWDFRMFLKSEMDEHPESVYAKALQEWQLGIGSPAALESAKEGLEGDPIAHIHEQRLLMLVEQFKTEGQGQPDQTIPPAVAMKLLPRLLEENMRHPFYDAIYQLFVYYQQVAQQQQQQAAMAAMPQQQGGGAPRQEVAGPTPGGPKPGEGITPPRGPAGIPVR